MNKIMPITGTFIDGIASDIPSSNWNKAQWEKQFENFKFSGIDTAIIIRTGWNDSAMYKSAVMNTSLYENDDLVRIILNAAEMNNIAVYIGLFDTHKYWLLNDWDSEVAINIDLIHELRERYDDFSAFKGWYMSHEGSMHFHQTKIWKPLCKEIKKFDRTRKILVSPRYQGKKYDPNCIINPEVHAKHFDHILNEMENLIDIYAFMDGHVEFCELENFVKATWEVFNKHKIEYWSNLETFDRDMPWKFPPIEWNKLRFKLETVQPYVEKIITFEAPHFLSPYSTFPAARNLYRRYMDYISVS